MDELLLRYLRKQTTEEENATVEEWVSRSPERERDLAVLSRVFEAAQIADRRIVPGAPPTAEEVIRRAEARRSGSPARGPARTGKWLVPALLRRVRYGLLAAGGIAIAVAAVFVMRLGVTDSASSEAEITITVASVSVADVEYVESETGPGETEMVLLGDGTVIRLGPESQVSVDSVARMATLQGEAFFAVATDAGRPFSIFTAAGIARVLGTRFYLAARADELAVTVVEGRVALAGPEHEVQAEAGQATSLLRGLPTPIESAAPVGSVAEWMDGFLIFHDTPLDAAMNEVEQHYGIEVLISDTSLFDHTLTMWFDSESLPEVMTVVCTAIDARCNIDDAGVVRIESAGPEGAS